MSSATLQKSIEDYMSPGRAAAAAAGQPAAMGGKAAAAAVPPPPPPAAEVIGQPLLKDFRCEESGKIRPFSGTVTEFHATKKWGGLYRVVYEDGDSEDLAWEQLHGFLQRAAAAGASKAGGSKPAGGSSKAGGGKAAAPAARLQQHAAPAPAAAAQKAPAGKHSAASKASGAAAAAAAAEPVPAKKRGRPAKGGAQPAAKQAKIGAGRKAQPGGGNGKAALAAKMTPTKATPAKQPVANKNPILLPTPKSNTQYVYARGEEPWRREAAFTWAVNDEPDMSATAVNNIRRVQRDYNRRYIRVNGRAATEEKIRVDAIIGKQKAAGTYKTKGVPTPANRPDRVVESIMKSGKMVLTDAAHKVAGHYPGWKVGARAYSRSELGCIGFHCSPIAGIDFVGVGKGGNGMPSFATSVMMSGWYQDDDDSGSMMWYTGAGGNALLNSRKQVADQKLNPANSALLGNIQLGIPVRVTRKQTDKHGHYGCAYVYDGLYDVVAYRRKKGITDKYVYQFQMIRREGQGPLLSERVEWRTIATAKDLAPKTRQGVVDLDISRGKEAKPIAAIDTTWLALGELAGSGPQGDLPPCTGLDDVAKERELAGNVVRGINEARLAQLRGQQYKAGVQYISQYEFAVEPPTLRQAVLPSKHAGNPHAYLRELNRGTPYNDRGQLYNSRPVVYECGPWAKCPDGHDCKQAVTQRPIKFRLEVFKTVTGCGWGVRCLDTIPQHAYVCTYIGEVYDRETHEHLVRTVEEQDAEYTFDMACRQETNWDGTEKEREDPDFKAEFVCCGLRKRNVGAFLNHSCAPNCFVQPVLDVHHDTRLPKICIFAMENIAPLTELTLDYGTAYAAGFPGGCKCGAADCISGPLSPAQAEAMAAAAARAAAVEVDAEEQKALEAEERKKAKEEEAKQIEAELRKAKAAAKKRGTAAAGKGKAAQAAVEEEEEEEEGSEEGEEGDDEEGSEEGGECSEEEDEGDEAASSPAEESSSGEEDWEEDDK